MPWNRLEGTQSSFRNKNVSYCILKREGTRLHSRWGTALQARMSRIRFPVGSLGFFIDILPAALWSWDRPSL